MRCLFSMGYVKFPRLKWQRWLGYNLITGRPPPPPYLPMNPSKERRGSKKKRKNTQGENLDP